ncbi:MAG: dihydropteroate synthase [Candidatus Promineifilaceae bacterium]
MFTTLSGTGTTVTIGTDLSTVVIGERINPTGKKSMAAALASGNMVLVREMAKAQVAAGADMLDVNVGITGCDEVDLLRRAVLTVSEVADVPLSIDTANPKALKAALKVGSGRPLVNSVNGEEKSLGRVLPLVKEYKTAVIGLTLDERVLLQKTPAEFRQARRDKSTDSSV